jgi:hypothetical protein
MVNICKQGDQFSDSVTEVNLSDFCNGWLVGPFIFTIQLSLYDAHTTNYMK